MTITIFQGRHTPPKTANITIVIDVIRAFTVAHFIFLQGGKRIYLVQTADEAFEMKKSNPEYLLIGEENGISIANFDFDNSPYQIQKYDFTGKTPVLRTTNGVQATLNSMLSDHIFVTGFTNARSTAIHIKKRYLQEKQNINIIASHPTGDDDLACAHFIESLLTESNHISSGEVTERIKHSEAGEKFFEEKQPNYRREDILCSIEEINSNFVMKVNKQRKTIERVNI